ncbi:fungal hydrophobin-domain-containing protein [Cubamyces lactineus]|nr:fungal hydrophobin-domain-containing protein [Cubamyces lactineus]
MFSRAVFTFYFVLSVTLLAAAMPACSPSSTTTITVSAPAPTSPGNSCTTGPIQCCESVGKASDPAFNALLGLLGIVIDGFEALLGLQCSPISIVGVGQSTCTANVVCCENNSVGSLISIGCIPIIL